MKQVIAKILFFDEAYTLTSKSGEDFGKEAIESITRYMFPSTGSVQHPVFIPAGYSENMVEFIDMDIKLRRRIKLKFMFQEHDHTIKDLSLCRLIKDHSM